MVVTIEYSNGRVTQFDTGALTSAAPFDAMSKESEGGAARVVMTRLDLRTDLLFTGGDLRIDVWYYSAFPDRPLSSVSDLGFEQACANLASATSVVLATSRGLKGAMRIIQSNGGSERLVAWRQGSGDWLINAAKFDAARAKLYQDATVESNNATAAEMFNILKRSKDDVSEEEAAEAIGYPLEAIQEAIDFVSARRSEASDEADDPDAPLAAGEVPPDAVDEAPVDEESILIDLDQPFDEDDE